MGGLVEFSTVCSSCGLTENGKAHPRDALIDKVSPWFDDDVDSNTRQAAYDGIPVDPHEAGIRIFDWIPFLSVGLTLCVSFC